MDPTAPLLLPPPSITPASLACLWQLGQAALQQRIRRPSARPWPPLIAAMGRRQVGDGREAWLRGASWQKGAMHPSSLQSRTMHP